MSCTLWFKGTFTQWLIFVCLTFYVFSCWLGFIYAKNSEDIGMDFLYSSFCIKVLIKRRFFYFSDKSELRKLLSTDAAPNKLNLSSSSQTTSINRNPLIPRMHTSRSKFQRSHGVPSKYDKFPLFFLNYFVACLEQFPVPIVTLFNTTPAILFRWFTLIVSGSISVMA